MPLIYGEGIENAFVRLLDEKRRRSSIYEPGAGTSSEQLEE
jgi:hypothetical protein